MCPTHYEQLRQNRSSRSIDNSPHPACAVSHCDIEATSRKEGSYCQPHYQKNYRGIDPETYFIPEDHPFQSRSTCAEPGCQKLSRSNGLCDYHRTRARVGKTQAVVSIKRTAPCQFDTCATPSSQGGWCQTHYEQLRRTGSVTEARTYGKYTKGELRCPIPNCRKAQVSVGLCGAHVIMKKKYRVSQDRLIEIWSNPTCSNPGCENTTRLHMDHDHSTGEFRALLCSGCNSALGFLKENPERISGLREYIERFS